METVQWKVDGMSCTNCALSIHKYLQSNGIEAPKVSFMDGEVQFEMPEAIAKEKLIQSNLKEASEIKEDLQELEKIAFGTSRWAKIVDVSKIPNKNINIIPP